MRSSIITLRASVHDDLRKHAKEEELQEANSEAEVGPVMTILHNVKAVTLEVDISIKVLLVEGLHGDLVVATVLVSVGLLLEVEVVLDGAAGELNLLGLAGRYGRDDQPPNGEDRKIDEDGKEDGSLEATSDLPAEVPGNQNEDRDQDIVVEGIGARAVSGKGGISDGRELLNETQLAQSS